MPLEPGEISWHRLAERWLLELRHRRPVAQVAEPPRSRWRETWQQIRKFLDYVEANAGSWWQVPSWQLGASLSPHPSGREIPEDRPVEDEDDDEEDSESLFGAAYEDMVFHDSADDGVEGPIFDGGSATDDELVQEAERVNNQLAFLNTLSRLWRVAALSPCKRDVESELLDDRARAMQRWATQPSATAGN